MRYIALFLLLATPAWALTDLSATDHAADVTATSVFAAGTSSAAGITGYYDAADLTAYLDTLYLGITADAAGVAANSVALTTDTTGNYVSSATANGGLALTGTEGGSLGMITSCSDNQVLAYTAAGGWACANDATGGSPAEDSITTTMIDDAADTPAAGELLVVGSTTTQVEYVSTINLQFTGAIGEVLLGDSDAAGAASTDEDSASVKTNMSTTTEDAEVSDWWVTSFGAATAGTEYTSLFWDGSDEALEIGTQTDAASPVTVAGSECLQIDTNTGTDNQVEIGNCTSSSGVTQLSFGALNVVTTGTITGNAPVATSTGGALAVNSVTIATAAGDYDLPDNCDSATGAWVMLYVRDVSETASLTVSAAEDTIVYKGLSLNADDELDSPGAAQDSVVVVCMEANKWYVTANSGDWTNGGAAD